MRSAYFYIQIEPKRVLNIKLRTIGSAYRIRENRFRILREMTKKHCPKLIVCTGITLKEDFVKCFTDNLMLNEEEIDDKSLFWVVNNNGSLVVIIPFMVNRYGLIRNVSITKFGQRVSELLELSKQN